MSKFMPQNRNKNLKGRHLYWISFVFVAAGIFFWQLTPLKASAFGFSDIANAADNIKISAVNLAESAKTVTKTVANKVAQGAQSGAENVGNGVGSAAGSVSKGATKGLDAILDGIDAVVYGVKEGAVKAGQALKKAPSAVKEGAIKAVIGLKNASSEVKDGLIKAGSGLKKTPSVVVQFIEEKIGQSVDKVSNFGKNFILGEKSAAPEEAIPSQNTPETGTQQAVNVPQVAPAAEGKPSKTVKVETKSLPSSSVKIPVKTETNVLQPAPVYLATDNSELNKVKAQLEEIKKIIETLKLGDKFTVEKATGNTTIGGSITSPTLRITGAVDFTGATVKGIATGSSVPTITYVTSAGTAAQQGPVSAGAFGGVAYDFSIGRNLSVGADTSLSGVLTVTGETILNGNITLGNATTDAITFTGYAGSSIIPKTTDTYNLGTSGLRWNNLYLASLSADTIASTTSTVSASLSVGTTTYFGLTRLSLDTANSNYKGITLRRATGQSANLIEWQNESGTVLGWINPSGGIGASSTSYLQHLYATDNNTYDLGTYGQAWRSVYSSTTAYINNTTIQGNTATSTFASSLNPLTNNRYDLGFYSQAWRNLYASGTIRLGNGTGLTTLNGDTTTSTFASAILPFSNNIYDFGNYGSAWKNAYASGTVYASSTDVSDPITGGYKIAGNIILRNPYTRNLLVGEGAGAVLGSSGTDNTFIGYYAGNVNTTGNNNSFIGSNAGLKNTIGGANVALGQAALNQNTEGNYNIAIGASALSLNSTGVNNSALGYAALTANTSGDFNIAFGDSALHANTTGDNNIALGISAGFSNNTGANNLFLGYGAGYNSGTNAIVTGSNNILIGYNVTATNTATSNFMNLGGAIYGWTGTGGTIYPSANNSRDFGLYGNAWKDIYASGSLYIGTAAGLATISGPSTSTLTHGASFASTDGGLYITSRASYPQIQFSATGSLYSSATENTAGNSVFLFDTLTNFTNAKLLSIRNAGTEKAYFDKDGGLSAASSTLAGTLTLNSNISGNLIPSSNNLYNIGVYGTAWKDVYASGTQYLSGNLNVWGNTTLGDTTSDTITATGRFASSLLPSTDNQRDLGAYGTAWKNIYASGSWYGDLKAGTHNVFDLGSYTNAWKNIYASGTIYGGSGSYTINGSTTSTFSSGIQSSHLYTTGGLTVAGGLILPNDSITDAMLVDTITASNYIEKATTTLNGMSIGASTASTGKFTTLQSTGLFTPTGGIATTTWDGVNIGVSTAGTGKFTTLWATGLLMSSSTALFDGPLTVYGNTTLGDATSDTITATGRFASSLLPSTDNQRDLGAYGTAWKNIYASGSWYGDLKAGTHNVFDLGSYTNAWKNIYASGTAYIGNTTISGAGTSTFVNGIQLTSGCFLLPDGTCAGAAAATKALDNLVSVAINTSLLSDANNTDDLGAFSKAWKDIYASGTIFASGTTIYGNGATSTFSGPISTNYFNATTEASAYRIDDSIVLKNNGTRNIAVGVQAGESNTGSDNVFVGFLAGQDNAGANQNTFVGSYAGQKNTATRNVYLGYVAGLTNTGGAQNVAIGWAAGYKLDSNSVANVIIGDSAGYGATGYAAYNVIIGDAAGYYLAGGDDNVMIGASAGYNISTGVGNVLIGKTAGQALSTQGGNTLVGYQAGEFSTSANNTMLGYNAGYTTGAGANGVFLGYQAGYQASGSNNTFLGYQAGNGITTGANNLLIGYDVDNATSTTSNNYINIGNTIQGWIGGNIYPYIHGTQDLGIYGSAWKNIYASGTLIIGDGTADGSATSTFTDGISAWKFFATTDNTYHREVLDEYFTGENDAGYELLTIENYEAYLRENRHLPNLTEDTGGIDVGGRLIEHEARLEELAVYILELNKKLNALETSDGTLALSEGYDFSCPTASFGVVPAGSGDETASTCLFGIKKISFGAENKWFINEEGLLKIKDIEADKVRTNKLEMVDEDTGEIYCVTIKAGEWAKQLGECPEIPLSARGGSASGGNPPLSKGEAEGDLDLDGYPACSQLTTNNQQPTTTCDCVDNDASVYPGRDEICGNLADDNCDGQADEGCATTDSSGTDTTDVIPAEAIAVGETPPEAVAGIQDDAVGEALSPDIGVPAEESEEIIVEPTEPTEEVNESE